MSQDIALNGSAARRESTHDHVILTVNERTPRRSDSLTDAVDENLIDKHLARLERAACRLLKGWQVSWRNALRPGENSDECVFDRNDACRGVVRVVLEDDAACRLDAEDVAAAAAVRWVCLVRKHRFVDCPLQEGGGEPARPAQIGPREVCANDLAHRNRQHGDGT